MNGFVFFFYIYGYHKKANLKYIYVDIFRDPGNRCCAQATKRVTGKGINKFKCHKTEGDCGWAWKLFPSRKEHT